MRPTNNKKLYSDSEKETRPRGLNHIKFSGLMLIISSILFLVLIRIDYIEIDKIVNKLVNASLFLMCNSAFSLFWNTRKRDADFQIWKNSIAVAIYLGLVAYALSNIFA